MITGYDFGKISINGDDYYVDVFIDWNEKVKNWQREESHSVKEKDLKEVLDLKPDIIVIGTGESEMLRVLPEIQELIINNDIGLVVKKTLEAISFFNKSLAENKKIIGLFHLTC
ncbi:MAG: MTH938/NDUFAF3 family protein [bacterium]|nr:MTH938/NDUFAF3 family protein [bacterium]